jgi:ABC-type nitrate/sulfonate/bicarbonate transport system permease component
MAARLSRSERRRSRLLAAAIVAGVVMLLQVAIGSGLIADFLLPSPLQIAESFPSLVSDEGLLRRFGMTALETLLAIGLATLLGAALGWLFHRRPVAWAAFRGWVSGLNAAPLILLYPLFLLVIGRGMATLVVIGTLAGLPPIVLKTREALASVRPILLAVGRSFNLDRRRQLWLIEWPAAAPTIVAGIRLGLFYALASVIGAEFLTGMGGLGALIPDLADRYQMPSMYGAILVVIATSALLVGLLRRVERWLRAG